MTAIITGDIINSRKESTELWLEPLKSVLNRYGEEPKHWQIYRGDSFQIEVQPELALEAAILIKATIKQERKLDVRMSIGIGHKEYESDAITNSNGEVFIFSGESFEQLKKNRLVIKTPWSGIDEMLNLMLELMQVIMNQWKPMSAFLVKQSLEHQEVNQRELASILNKSQGTVSEGLKRAAFDEIMKINNYYIKIIQAKCLAYH